MEVRQAFGSKVQRTLLTLYNQPGSHSKAAKYAAVLSLAGMDPATANQQAALACLQQFAAVRRQAVQLSSPFNMSCELILHHCEWMLQDLCSVCQHSKLSWTFSCRAHLQLQVVLGTVMYDEPT